MNSEIFFNVFFAFFDALFLSSILICPFFTRSFFHLSFLRFYLLTHERRRRIDALFLSLIFFVFLGLPSFSDSFTPKNPSTTYYNLCRYKFLNLKNYPKSEVKNGSRDAGYFSDSRLLTKNSPTPDSDQALDFPSARFSILFICLPIKGA